LELKCFSTRRLQIKHRSSLVDPTVVTKLHSHKNSLHQQTKNGVLKK